MPRAMKLDLNPAVLEWARKTAGLTIAYAASQLGVSEDDLRAFESGRKEPPLTLLRQLARIYKRAFAVMLLSEPPETESIPTDFRTLPGNKQAIGPETALALRQARRLQEVISDIVEENPSLFPKFNLPTVSQRDEAQEVGEDIRITLKMTSTEQHEWLDEGVAFRAWRGRLQTAGLITLVEDMPREECRGFSLWHPELIPVIVVNSGEAPSAQSFTLFHELGHLLLKSDAMCLKQENSSFLGSVEAWCNRFAAAVLVPARDFQANVQKFFTPPPGDWDLNDLGKLAKAFRVSRHVIAIRLEELGLAPKGYYQHVRHLLESDDTPKTTRKLREDDESKRDMSRERLSEIGYAPAQAILAACRTASLSTMEAVDLLKIRPKSFERLAMLAEQQRQRYA